ncbi:uncharacterized protein BX663DRAFT_140672 [Cokeromyces recurvatus]|uniref:uncharacterized protein n=1 Tax=Cokeromyces recurvatus TaxID=90255 RepID=UPI00221FFD2B|nr:uncharacterized protein BX663DRAFT_140672 [Cokeromyces recurvatus]KAI7900959.1 hypothetical protein BX663DRAFT_140672 [Cokeromyces recurvatus]
MFTSSDQSKKKFIENARLERDKREKERIEKLQIEKETKAALVIQKWWRRGQEKNEAQAQCWQWWNAEMEENNNNNNNLFSIIDFYQLLGLYCILTRKKNDMQVQLEALKKLVKCLIANKFSHHTTTTTTIVPFYALLIDMRYMHQARIYLEYIIMQCIHQQCDNTTSTGPELLTFLLQFLNPKTYQTKQFVDVAYLIDIPDKVLQSIAQSILKVTLCQRSRGSLRPALVKCVEQIIKLEDRKIQDMTKINALKLWLTTMTRLTLYPIEHAELSSDALDMDTASQFLWTTTLAVPCITSLINTMMTDRLRKWALGACTPHLMLKTFNKRNECNKTEDMMESLSGNGGLFLLANLIDLWNSSKNPTRSEEHIRLVELVRFFLDHIESFFSDKQSPSSFPHYHPVFKWSRASWGNTISSAVFDRIMKQIEYIWSRSFMDQVFTDIIHFRHPHSRFSLNNSNKNNRLSFSSKLKGIHQQYDLQKYSGELALFSIEVEAIFSMYIQLTQLFKAHRRVIFYRIAFTSDLMPQLWKLMNHFGPKGKMTIYLDAAKQNNIEKEPLIQVLKIFCEACSIVFLTLDDVDIFTHKTPFSPEDLIDISDFLNSFYFTLIQQHTDIPAELPPAAESFKSARRLLLQIYDLDLHHPFCPPNHWLLVSSMTNGVKSFFSSLFQTMNNSIQNDNNGGTLATTTTTSTMARKKKIASSTSSSSSAALFLTNLKQGDPVPLRVLQLMPHTVSFDMRLQIFRDWIALDQSMVVPKISKNRYINVRRNYVLEDGFHALSNLPPSAWKGTIRVSFVNELGVEEAGIDQGGPFKDFLTMLISEAFEPNYDLFSLTKHNSFYPSATSGFIDRQHIELFEFIGKAIGKAVYEGILLDVQFAGFLLARLLGRNVFLEELKELDEEVWRNLTFIKHYEGDVEDLCLSFETNEEVLGKIESHELKFRGRDTTVTNSNKIEYIYLMADYKLNQRAREQTKAFIHGFRTVISENWIRLFSPPELQRYLKRKQEINK